MYRSCWDILNSSISTINGITKSSLKQPPFLLCGSCFWCASYINMRGTIEKCPACMDGKVESIPILDQEVCVFSYDAIRGVTLEFITNRWPANSRLVICYYVYSILLLLFFRIILLITLTILFPRLNIPLLENSELKYDCILLLYIGRYYFLMFRYL